MEYAACNGKYKRENTKEKVQKRKYIRCIALQGNNRDYKWGKQKENSEKNYCR